jgi:hypothetical protein
VSHLEISPDLFDAKPRQRVLQMICRISASILQVAVLPPEISQRPGALALPHLKYLATSRGGPCRSRWLSVDCQGERYLVAMLDQKSNWVRNLRADGHAVLRHGQSEDVSLVEDLLR